MKKHIAVLAMLATFFTACEQKHEEWTPGDPDASGTIGVYFDNDNPGDLVLIPGKSTAVEISVHRVITDSAVDVPLITSSTVEGLAFPQSIHFDAGQADATISIDCSNLPQKTKVKYHVGVPDEYLMIYNDSRLNSHDGSVLVSAWESANNDNSPVRFVFTSSNRINATSAPFPYLYEEIFSEMEVLPGAGLYRIKDFLGSGSDFIFTLEASVYPKFKGYHRIVPQEDYYYTMAEAYDDDSYGEAYYNAWFLIGDDGDYSAPTFKKLDGSSVETDSMMFYWYSDNYSGEYCYARLAGTADDEGVVAARCSASMWTAIGSDYLYLYFSWDKSAQ